MDFEKYKALHQQGYSINQVYDLGKADGLDGWDLFNLLMALGMRAPEAARIVEADGLHVHRELERSPNVENEDQTKFKHVLTTTLEAAARVFEHYTNQPVPRTFRINIIGVPRHNGEHLTVEEAIKRLFLGENLYLPVIRARIMGIHEAHLYLELIPDGKGVPFERTWNHPPGAGPFKFINLTDEGYQIVEDTFREMAD
jgi:hypothetical protein